MLGWLRRGSGVGAPAAVAIAALVALAPRAGSAEHDAPELDLSRIQLDADGATAPLEDGGEARLTLDAELQRAAQKLLGKASPLEGAVTLVDARTGEVLVFAELARNGGGVVLRSRQPAASLFKLVTTAALLEGGEVTPRTKVCTSGGNHRIERRHLEHPRTGPIACQPFGLALGHSRNAVYAQLATLHLSRQELIDTAERLGFNRRLPFDVPALTGTLEVPVADLEFARTAAGFQGSTLSPLGALHLGYVVATGGLSARLRIRRPEDGAARREIVGRVLGEDSAAELRRMMEVTVREGTSAEAFLDADKKPYLGSLRVAGKTGTLQPAPGKPTTSWFVGFAPSRRPQVVVSVLLVNGKVWRRKANEVGRDMLRFYFAKRHYRGITTPFDG